MSRRRRGEGAGSLELLLDTMCNAFGGVMFIAILLVILSQFVDTRKIEATEDKTLEERRRRVELSEAAQGIEARLRTARAELDAAFRLHANRPLLERIKQLRAENAKIEQQRDASKKELDKTQREFTQRTEEKERRKKELTELQERLRRLIERLGKRDEEDVRTLRMPRIRKVRKSPFWMIVKDNRLYVLHRPSRLRGIGPPNEKAARRDERKGYVIYTPFPKGGVPLKGDWRDSPEVRRILADLPSRAYLLYFAVWPDSYAAFRQVRDFFIAKGYRDYFWLIMSSTDTKLRLLYVTQDKFDAL